MSKVINPTSESIRALKREVAADTPIVMLNLLRFRAQAAYPRDSGFAPCSGLQAYARYSEHGTKALAAVGVRVLWSGRALSHPICPPDELWHQIILVEYPTIAAFLGMVMAQDYQRHTLHRSAALEDARLVCMQQQ